MAEKTTKDRNAFFLLQCLIFWGLGVKDQVKQPSLPFVAHRFKNIQKYEEGEEKNSKSLLNKTPLLFLLESDFFVFFHGRIVS